MARGPEGLVRRRSGGLENLCGKWVLKHVRRSRFLQACDQRLCVQTPSQNVQRLVRRIWLEDLSGGLRRLVRGTTSWIKTLPPMAVELGARVVSGFLGR
jgi:hypothetical protein